MTGPSLSAMQCVTDHQGGCELTRRALWHNRAQQLLVTVPEQLQKRSTAQSRFPWWVSYGT